MEENKNLLFVGDLTPAHNYGAIATSESLKKLIEQRFKNVRYIDFRSFINPTPLQGWDKNKLPKTIKENIMDCLKWPFALLYHSNPTVGEYFLRKISKKRRALKMALNHPDIPYLFEQYDDYCKLVLHGDILQYEYELLKWCDIVYINGEGNIVHGTDKHGKYRPGALYILFLAYFAKKYLNKYCAIVNHTVDPDNQDAVKIIKNVYPMLDHISVREPFSKDYLRSLGIENVRMVPDALFTFEPDETWNPSTEIKDEIDFSRPYICLGDGSAIKSATNQVKWDVYSVYCELIDKLKIMVPQIIFIDGFNSNHESINKVIEHKHLGRVNLHNCSYRDLYNVLKQSEIFISGRYHSSILSIMSGTPILLWGADSYKTKGLYRLLDYPYRFFETDTLPIHIDDMILETKKILNDRKEIKRELLQKVDILRELSYKNTDFKGY